MILTLDIRANEGYCAADAARHTITVGELRAMLEDYDDDVRIVSRDLNNPRGADYGAIVAEWLEEADDEDDADE